LNVVLRKVAVARKDDLLSERMINEQNIDWAALEKLVVGDVVCINTDSDLVTPERFLRREGEIGQNLGTLRLKRRSAKEAPVHALGSDVVRIASERGLFTGVVEPSGANLEESASGKHVLFLKARKIGGLVVSGCRRNGDVERQKGVPLLLPVGESTGGE